MTFALPTICTMLVAAAFLVHRYNFADLPLWDRLSGTYRDADQFAERCGFPRHNERQLGRMLLFRDVYKD